MLASLSASERQEYFQSLTEDEAVDLLYDWHFWARPAQLAPPGDWLTWLIKAGRGFGKTRAGSGWVNDRAFEHPGRWIALIAKTPSDARDYMIEGPGGFLKNTHPQFRPHYESSKRRLTWPNGSWATIYSSEEPDQIRGFSGDTAWLDELAKFNEPKEVMDNLDFGMREASNDFPRKMIMTTPRPIPIMKEIEADPHTVITSGSSYDNRANLAPTWYEKTLAKYVGTRLGRQEIFGERLEDNPGALWQHSNIEKNRVKKPPCDLKRIVVAIDPAATSNPDADDTGIVVAGLGTDNRGYVLADLTMHGTPKEWATASINAYHDFKADRIIGETNNGGEMIETVIRMLDNNVSYKAVHASRGKITRAEPISALYEQDRISHVGMHPDLEDQMCDYDPKTANYSPDRMDALVWALTELMAEVSVGDTAIEVLQRMAEQRALESKNPH